MKVVLPSGSGQVGRILGRALVRDGHEVVVLSRKPTEATAGQGEACRTVVWDAISLGDWVGELDGADVVINLAGRSVDCRYNDHNRRLIMDSRVHSTRVVGQALAQVTTPPKVWLQASTATIYAHTFGDAHDERGVLGGNEPGAPSTWRFSIEVAQAWEAELEKAATPHTRKVALRSAMTMSPDRGGVFDVLSKLVRRGLGGRSGDGKQFMSWIHETDFVRAIYWLIDRDVEGAVNVCAPTPIPNGEFMAALRRAWGRRFGLPAARWMIEVGAFFMRTESELVLKSRRVVPRLLMERGFQFEYPEWPDAARELRERC